MGRVRFRKIKYQNSNLCRKLNGENRHRKIESVGVVCLSVGWGRGEKDSADEIPEETSTDVGKRKKLPTPICSPHPCPKENLDRGRSHDIFKDKFLASKICLKMLDKDRTI